MRLRTGVIVDPPHGGGVHGREEYFLDKQRLRTAGHVCAALEDICETRVIRAGLGMVDELRDMEAAIAFNLSCGVRGESRQSQVPAILEMVGIPYTGSGVLGHALALDKAAAKAMFLQHGVNTPRYAAIFRAEDIPDDWTVYPAIVKPGREGSGAGIHKDSVVYSNASMIDKALELLELYGPPILVEEFIEGREFTVGVLGNGAGAVALPPMMIDFSEVPEEAGRFYTFEVKVEHGESTRYYCPAPVGEILDSALRRSAVRAFASLALRDLARVDIREREGIPYVIEINSLPGLDEGHSDLPKMARASGMSYRALIVHILTCACRRHGISIGD